MLDLISTKGNLFVIPSAARHSSPSHAFCAMNLLFPVVFGFVVADL